MKAKKIIIGVFAVVLAMQMTGCKNNIDTSKPVVIDVSVSENDIESKAELTWTELGELKTCEKMRTAVDTVFGNDIVDGVKYGPFYIDSQGNQCTNNTLKVVLGNRYVAEMFATGGNVDIEKVDSSNLGAIESTTDSDEDASTAMTESFNSSLASVYNDLSDSNQSPALFNAYFNLLPDSTPNYFNGGDTLSRAEAMSLVTRATTPVQSLNVSDDFTSAVTGTDYDQYINYAAQQNENSYINTNDKSLTADNFKGAMSRAEFIYLIMNEVYGADEVQNYNTSKTTLKDCTNAGNLSEELKIADSDRCNGYTLKYSLENVDKGVTEELYKSIAMAADKGIITTETRWNEGITKSEAIEIVVNAFMQYYDEQGYLVNSAEKGSTQALEAAAEALWNKQDQNDMNCTKEEFIADYIKAVSDGMTPEEFEKNIGRAYSNSYAEELAKIEEEERKKQEDAVKKAEEEAKAAKEAQKQQEQQSSNNGGSSSNNSGTSNNGGGSSNSGEGSSNNGGTSNGGGGSSNNGGGSSNNGGGSSNNEGSSSNNGGSVVLPSVDDVDNSGGWDDTGWENWGDQSDWESWE